MGRLKPKIDYESNSNARILENQARLEAIGLCKTISNLRSIASSVRPRKYCKVDYRTTPLRRSERGKHIKADSPTEHISMQHSSSLGGKSGNLNLSSEELQIMGGLKPKVDYESLRNARILENQARLEAIGLCKTISNLRSIVSSVRPRPRKYCKVDYRITPPRRSERLKHPKADSPTEHISMQHSSCLGGKSGNLMLSLEGKLDGSEEENEEFLYPEMKEQRPGNAPLLKRKALKLLQLSPEVSAQRCNSPGRGSIYNSVFGICCHFCRQKKLCGEEDCKRCGYFDKDQPCIGKTDCSVCHSSNGVLCRACLKVRYGEEMEDVRQNKEWMCPHCIEEKGINPYWICNSSICLKKRNMSPTGIAIFKAREKGYKSVAHLLMDKLQAAKKYRK